MSGETHKNAAGVTEIVVVVRFLLGPDSSIPEFLTAATNGLMEQLPSWSSGRYRTKPEISAAESSMGEYAEVAAGKSWNPTDPQEGTFVMRWQLDSECANHFLLGGHTATTIRSALISAWRNAHPIGHLESKASIESIDAVDGLVYEVEDDDDYVNSEADDSGKDEKKSAANREITFTIDTPNRVNFFAAKNNINTCDDGEESMAHYLHRCSLRQYQAMLEPEDKNENQDTDDCNEEEEEEESDAHYRYRSSLRQYQTMQEPTTIDEIEEMLDEL